MTSSSAGQLKSPQTFFVCRSVAPSHFRSSSSLIRLYFQCICIAMFPCICVWFLLYLFYVFAHSHLPTSYALPHSLKILPLPSWTSPGKDEEQSFFLSFLFLLPPLYHSPDKHGHNVEGLTQTNPSLFWEIFPNAEDRPWLLTEFLKTSSHIKETAICMMSMRG